MLFFSIYNEKWRSFQEKPFQNSGVRRLPSWIDARCQYILLVEFAMSVNPTWIILIARQCDMRAEHDIVLPILSVRPSVCQSKAGIVSTQIIYRHYWYFDTGNILVFEPNAVYNSNETR